MITVTVAVVVIAGITGATAIGATDDPASKTDEHDSQPMTQTEFSWGTVAHETDSETDTMYVDVIVEVDDGASVSATTTSDGTTDSTAHVETEQFSWGVVGYTIDSDTGTVDIEVIIDGTDDVSVSVTTVSEDGTQESTSTIHQSGTEAADGGAGADVTVSQSSVNSNSSTVVHGEDGDDGDSISIDID